MKYKIFYSSALLLFYFNLWPDQLSNGQVPAKKQDTTLQSIKAVDNENEQLKKKADKNDSIIAQAAIKNTVEKPATIRPRIVYRWRKAPKPDTVYICPMDTTATAEDIADDEKQTQEYIADLNKQIKPTIIYHTDTVYIKNKPFLWFVKLFTKKQKSK